MIIVTDQDIIKIVIISVMPVNIVHRGNSVQASIGKSRGKI